MLAITHNNYITSGGDNEPTADLKQGGDGLQPVRHPPRRVHHQGGIRPGHPAKPPTSNNSKTSFYSVKFH